MHLLYLSLKDVSYLKLLIVVEKPGQLMLGSVNWEFKQQSTNKYESDYAPSETIKGFWTFSGAGLDGKEWIGSLVFKF